MIIPKSRNAIDSKLPYWSNGKWWPYWPDCTNGTTPCSVGQSCFWFSNGCTIGCKTCTGHPANPNTKDLCDSGMKATICDKSLRTYNVDAECNSEHDIYKHNPWRAPGAAPVFDS